MKKRSPGLSRRKFVGTLAAVGALPVLGRASILSAATSPAQAAPQAPTSSGQARTLEQERREALENLEKALKPIRDFSLSVEVEPAFIFRARR